MSLIVDKTVLTMKLSEIGNTHCNITKTVNPRLIDYCKDLLFKVLYKLAEKEKELNINNQLIQKENGQVFISSSEEDFCNHLSSQNKVSEEN